MALSYQRTIDNRPTNRQTDRQTDSRTNRQTNRLTNHQTDRLSKLTESIQNKYPHLLDLFTFVLLNCFFFLNL